MIKTFTILKRGRKYFEAQLDRYKAKIVINPISDSLTVGQTVTLEVKDISERSEFGVVLKFDPIAIRSATDLASEAKRKEGEKWLKYAEDDVSIGKFKTKAIDNALGLRNSPDFRDRVIRLEQNIRKNEQEYRDSLNALRYKAPTSPRQESPRKLFPMSDLPPLNTPVRMGSSIVVFIDRGKSFTISDDAPSVHGSYLLGHEGSLGCYSYYRDATPDEVASLVSQEEAGRIRAEEKRRIRDDIQRIKSLVKRTGSKPGGMNNVTGERLLDTMNIYGGGDVFIISDRYLWYVENNGGDGDNWAANNVQTGGAGAIGYRIARDPELERKLRLYDQQSK